jgi:hypothetical protein
LNTPAEWRARFLEAAAERKLTVGDDMLDMLERLSKRPALPTPQEPSTPTLPLSLELIQAAIGDTFTAADLRGDADPAVIKHSTVVMIDGQRRLRLNSGVRADVLRRAQGGPLFTTALTIARAADAQRPDVPHDSLAHRQTAWVRKFLTNDFSDEELSSARELRAATQARSALAEADLPATIPSLAELQNKLGLAELLEPLRILIGSTISPGSNFPQDRFIGREAELKALRVHVDELDSESAFESFGRGIQSLGRALSSATPGVLMLVARGGLGKSSLMAKFVLDHVGRPRQPFPFAYLDFDRATLQARPQALLEETARQVALQFPGFREALAKRSRVGSQQEPALEFGEFRELLNRTVFSAGARCLLLVFDTLEIAQRDQRAIRGLISFVDSLSGDGFPKLRIVAAGRAKCDSFIAAGPARRSGDSLTVLPLTVPEAAAMADRLGVTFLGPQWQAVWAPRIAGKTSDPATRREPLVIRVAVDLIKSSPVSQRDKLSLDIEKLGEAAGDSFAGALYERRVLDHVGDVYAAKLAWPGLVLRSISRDIVRTLLAPLCGLDDALVDHAFDALAQEVWIVEQAGDVLRHRTDLRSRTLAHMCSQARKKDFDKVNSAAIDYFTVRKEESPGERSEWIYHRLLGGEKFEDVYADWDENVASYLKGAWEDFTLLLPRTAASLRAFTEYSLIDPSEFGVLGRGLALDHIARAAPHLASHNDIRIDPTVLAASRLDDTSKPLSVDGKAAALVLAVKAGDWIAVDDGLADSSTSWQQPCAIAFRYRRARILDAKSAQDIADDIGEDFKRRSENRSPHFPDERVDLALLVHDFAAARIWRMPFADEMEQEFRQRLQDLGTSSTPKSTAFSAMPAMHTGALRAAGAVSERYTSRFVNEWIRRRREGHSVPATVCGRELLVLMEDTDENRRTTLRRRIDRAGERNGLTFSQINRRGGRVHSRIEDELVVKAFEDHVLLLADDTSARLLLRKLLAVRNEDWVVPLGYAAELCIGGGQSSLPRAVLSRLSTYWPRIEPGIYEAADCLQLMRYADQAGDLMPMVEAVLKAGREGAFRERLQRLADRLGAWQFALEAALETKSAPLEEELGADAAATGEHPPAAPPAGPDPDDPQKGRWGGKSQRNGRNLTAVVVYSARQFVLVDFRVSSTDGSVLQGPVVFHLHDSYPRSIIRIRKIREGVSAVLEEVSANGTYTVGAQMRDASGHWISLEFDLASLRDLPAAVRQR